MKYKDDSDILSTFLLECKDHLEVIEHGVLMLESNVKQSNEDLINKMFRAAHSIKAGANLLEFRNIEAVAHVLEEIMQQVRLGAFKLTGDDVTHFLMGIDKLNEMLDNIHYCDIIDLKPLIKLLNKIIK